MCHRQKNGKEFYAFEYLLGLTGVNKPKIKAGPKLIPEVHRMLMVQKRKKNSQSSPKMFNHKHRI